MEKHDTHFDDCGCKSEKYEIEIAKLKKKLKACRKLLTFTWTMARQIEKKEK